MIDKLTDVFVGVRWFLRKTVCFFVGHNIVACDFPYGDFCKRCTDDAPYFKTVPGVMREIGFVGCMAVIGVLSVIAYLVFC